MRAKLAVTVAAALMGSLLVATPATADTAPATSLAGAAPASLIPARPTPGEVRRALTRIARDSDGRVRLGVIGRSNEGRALRLASVGHGDTRLLYVTQQHGNEPLGTAWRLVGSNGSIEITLTSQDSLPRFIGKSFEVISRRSR